MSRWTLREVLKRAAEVLREEGLKSLWFKALGETVYRRVVLMERPLDEPVVAVEARLPVVISLLEETEVDEYIGFRPEAAPSEVRRRLEGGQSCFVARHEDRIVHSAWAATRRAWIEYLAREIQLAPDEVYVYESFTAPGFRGQNIAPARETQMIRIYRDAGYRRSWAAIMPENKPAYRPFEKLGYRPFGVLGYVKIGPWRRDFCRVDSGSLPPGASLVGHDTTYWDGVVWQLGDEQHYLDPFLGEMKRQAHLALIERWGGVPTTGGVLKTDLFEEALGPDAFLTDLSNNSRLVIGTDISEAIAGQAQRRDTNRRARYVAADVRRPPFASSTFALVVSPSTLDHFANPSDLGRSLRELGRVLEPTGQLIVTLDNRQNVFDPLLRLAIRLGLVPYYVGRSHSVGELCAELEAAGLAVRDTTAILHNPRLVATAAVTVANRLRWPPFTRLVHRALMAARRLEQTRWRYRTGSFVAACAVRLKS